MDKQNGPVDEKAIVNSERQVQEYADNLATQLRKGFLAYCVLLICQNKAVYTSDIIASLHNADMVVVEGTIYPLLNRLQRDGLLSYEWQESEQGPPRKYYVITKFGRQVVEALKKQISDLNKALKSIEKGELK